MRQSERRNNLQICPRRDSNTGGSDLWSSTLPLDHGGAPTGSRNGSLFYIFSAHFQLEGCLKQTSRLGNHWRVNCHCVFCVDGSDKDLVSKDVPVLYTCHIWVFRFSIGKFDHWEQVWVFLGYKSSTLLQTIELVGSHGVIPQKKQYYIKLIPLLAFYFFRKTIKCCLRQIQISDDMEFFIKLHQNTLQGYWHKHNQKKYYLILYFGRKYLVMSTYISIKTPTQCFQVGY